MKVEITTTKEYDAKYLYAFCGVRYWEDAEVDGIEDKDGTLIPCRDGKEWCPIIDIDNGLIINWEVGKTAKLHYKVCDDGTYRITDNLHVPIKEIDGYVPDIMCPDGEGFGDYVIMEIDKDGYIQRWKPDLHEFEENER